MALPENMIDRWARRRDSPPGERTLYWHVLVSHVPEIRDLAHLASSRLASFTALHLTPINRLHMTVLEARPADRVTDQQIQRMTQVAADHLDGVVPVPASIGKVLYHPEAVMLAVTPAAALAPIRAAALAATEQADIAVRGHHPWTPHITLCYSTADQPAGHIVDALGLRLPEHEITIDNLSLVVQHGPEREWNWTTVGTVQLGKQTVP